MFSGQENTETPVVNNIVYNRSGRPKHRFYFFPRGKAASALRFIRP
jgi:hypothetical protein